MRRPHHQLLAIGLVAVLAVLLAASRGGRQEAELRAGHAAPRLLPERHPRAGHRRRREGLFEKARQRTSTLEITTFNAGTEALTAFRPARSTPPTSARTPPSTRGRKSTRA